MKHKKTAGTVNISDTSSDMFTALCLSELGINVVKEYRFCQRRKWRFDYAAPQHRVALEVEGGVWSRGRHTRPQGFLGDMEKYNTCYSEELISKAISGRKTSNCDVNKIREEMTFFAVEEVANAFQNFLEELA